MINLITIEKTILLYRPTNKEIDKMKDNAMIVMNKEAFPYVPKVFPESIRLDPIFQKFISKYCIVPLVIPVLTCKMCYETLARGIKRGKGMVHAKKYKEGAIVTDRGSILGAGYTTFGQHHGDTQDK